jgi:hypothetical protein
MLGRERERESYNYLFIYLLDCNNCQQPIETFRFIGPSYFLVKYYFNSINNNKSNTISINDDKVFFIELLTDVR